MWQNKYGDWWTVAVTHTHRHAHTDLIPNKHHKVIMCNLSTALFSCSASLSRHHSVEMQTQVPTVWRHSTIIIPQTVPNNRLWQMVVSTMWTSLGNEKSVLPDTRSNSKLQILLWKQRLHWWIMNSTTEQLTLLLKKGKVPRWSYKLILLSLVYCIAKCMEYNFIQKYN